MKGDKPLNPSSLTDSELTPTSYNAELNGLYAPPEATTVRNRVLKGAADINSSIQRGILKDRFELIERLGAGGMGEVFRAKDRVRERMEDSSPYVALKLLKGSLTHLHEAMLALQREAKKAQTLSHPNIVTVYDFDLDGDTAFLTMEYLPGQSLHEYLRQNNSMPYHRAMKIIEYVARGLAYAHQEGFVHADIKPSNIYLQDGGGVKILDLGIAKAFRDTQDQHLTTNEKLTESALTPAYASPQMLEGEQPLPSDDVYSLAVVAFMLLTGAHPFLDARGYAIPSNEARSHELAPPEIRGVSRRHLRALQKALAFDRAKRFANAGEFIDAIKPRDFKKDFLRLAAAGALTSIFIFSTQFGLQQVTPLVDSLPAEMQELKKLINEGDAMLKNNDIDRAHRLYAQSKTILDDEFNPLDRATQDAREILTNRRSRIIRELIRISEDELTTNFQLHELLIAFESLQKDELTQDQKLVDKQIKKIKQALSKN